MSARNQPNPSSVKQDLLALLNPWVWRQFIHQTWLNIKSSKTHYFLGFAACWLVIVVVAVLISLLAQTPIIFLRLSETSGSEIDLRIDALTATGYATLNYTRIQTLMTESDEQHTSPRLIRSRLWSSSYGCSLAGSSDDSWLYSPKTTNSCSISCPISNCRASPFTWVRSSVLFFFFDFGDIP